MVSRQLLLEHFESDNERVLKRGEILKKVILCIGTLDTKGPELLYIKQLIEQRSGYEAWSWILVAWT